MKTKSFSYQGSSLPARRFMILSQHYYWPAAMRLWAKLPPYTMILYILQFLKSLFRILKAIFRYFKTVFIPTGFGDRQRQPCSPHNAKNTAYSQLEGTAGSHLVQCRANLALSRLLRPYLVFRPPPTHSTVPLDNQFQWLGPLTTKDLTGKCCRKQNTVPRNAISV